MKRKAYLKYILILLLPAGLLLNYISSLDRYATERIYSNFIYKGIYKLLSSATGRVPVSIAEILLILLILLVIIYIIRASLKFIRYKALRTMIIKDFCINFLAFAGLSYFAFVVMWGINYNRPTISEIFDLEIIPASVEELTELSEYFVREVNALRDKVAEDKRGIMYSEYGYKGVFDRAGEGFEAASKVYPQLGTTYGKPKGILLSDIMSYTGIWGIYVPFTSEANVNINIPASLLPHTINHEMAHQLGFAREEEANYIAYLTCKMHPDPDFNYSGALFAVLHIINEVYRYSPDIYNALMVELNEGVIRDIQEIKRFNKSYDGNVKQAFLNYNDFYLKMNGQEQGLKSYRRVVDYLVAEYRLKQDNLYRSEEKYIQ